MKRVITFFLAITILISFSTTSLIAFAEEIKETQREEVAVEVEDLLHFSCSYNVDTEKVTVNGSMNHDAFAAHGNSTLEIYAIPPGMSEYDVINDSTQKPLAEAAVSIRFGFSFKINKLIERYSRYAIFLRSEDQTRELATEAQYPEVISERNRVNDKEYFKGLATESITKASGANLGTAIVPVYLDELFTKTSDGYIYHIEEDQLFFSKAYIDKLDAQINSLSASGTRVYLQLLLRYAEGFGLGEKNGADYYMPNVYEENVLVTMHSAVDFLASRYTKKDLSNIFGIIIGKGWDNYSKYNSSGAESFDTYVEQCELYTVIVANAARSVEPSLDIVLPFTAENFKKDSSFLGVEGKSFSVKRLIEALLAYFDASFVHGIDCSFLMETAEMPFGITNQNIDGGVDKDFSDYKTEVYAGGQKLFSDYCNSLESLYESAPGFYIFSWTVPKGLGGNALAAAYAYSYYSLMNDGSISCFVLDTLNNSNAIADIFLTLKYINTAQGLQNNSGLLQYFGVSSWNELPKISLENISGNKNIHSILPSFSLPSNIIGSFNYFDFSGSTLTDGWYKGVGCRTVKIDYASSSNKALKAELALGNNDFGQLIYAYPKYENMSHTPYLAFDVRMSDSLEESLYEVEIVLESSVSRSESSCVVKGNEDTRIVIDISQCASNANVERIKISARSIYGAPETATLLLFGISGHSEEHDSSKLEELIDSEREKISNSQAEEKTSNTFEKAAIVIGVAIIIGSLAIGLFITFKKSRSDE